MVPVMLLLCVTDSRASVDTSRVDLNEFFDPKILIVSGKGGVGKTTVAAALALTAARQGRTVCVAEVDRKGTLPKLFGGRDLTYEPREMAPGVWGMNIIPERALGEYLDVQYHMKRVSRVLTSSHFVDYVTTAAPGLKEEVGGRGVGTTTQMS